MSVKQAVRVKVAKRITQQRDAESVFEPPALSVEPAIQARPPTDSTAGHSIETTDVVPGLRSVTPKIQRKESDEGSPAPAPVPAPPPDGSGSGAEQLSAGGTGSTNILAPTVSSKTYSGKTLQDVANAMPEEPGSLTFNIAAATDGDPITKATVTVRQVMVLARWAERDKQCKPIQAAWDRFASALRTHEDEHVKINKQQLATAHDRYVGRAKSDTQAVTTELETETFDAGVAFDGQTDHGKTATPSTTIDVGVKCDDKTTSIDVGGGDEEAVQAKLEVSEPGDPDEEEADRVAEQVMRMAEPDDSARVGVVGGARVIQRCAACEAEEEKWKASAQTAGGAKVRRKCAECEAREKGEGGEGEGGQGEEKKERVRRKASNGRSVVDESSRVTAVARSGGHPLDAETRAFMEPRFGFDFGRVRIHADTEAAEAARSVNAYAYTLGRDIVFDAGRYAPDSAPGRRLLAHELTHVVQQGAAATPGDSTFTPAPPQLVQRDSPPGVPDRPPQAPGPAPGPAPPGADAQPADPTKQIIKPPSPNGDLLLHEPSKLLFSDSADYIRFQLETHFTEKGVDLLEHFDVSADKFALFASSSPLTLPGAPPGPGVDTAKAGEYRKKVIAAVTAEVTALRSRVKRYEEYVQRRANDMLEALLRKSEDQLKEDKKRYGVEEKGSWFWKKHTMGANDEKGGLVDYAKRLKVKHDKFTEVLQSQPVAPRAELPEGGTPSGPDADAYQQRQDAITKQQAALKPFEEEYNGLRSEAEGKHPILVAYNLEIYGRYTKDSLTTLASDSPDARAEMVGKEIDSKLENIQKVRDKTASDKTRVWKLERVIGPTKNLPDVMSAEAPMSGFFRQAVISDHVLKAVLDEEFQGIAIGVIAFTIGVIAALPTGGMSVGAAAAVSAAGTAAAVLDAALMVQAVQDHLWQTAASGTNYDKAKAITQDDPDLMWLALSMIPTLQSLAGGLGAARNLIKGVAMARNEALGLKAAKMQAEAELANRLEAKYQQSLTEVENAANNASPGSGKRMRAEVENTDPSRVRRSSSGPDSDVPTPRVEAPVSDALMLNRRGEPMTQMDAFSEYHVQIESNPNREYAVIRKGDTPQFAVVVGGEANVRIPEHLPDGWRFVTHYHPNFEWINPKDLRKIPGSNFKARIPSGGAEGDMIGAMNASNGKPVRERLDWLDPDRHPGVTHQTVYSTHFGYEPGPPQVFWVEHASEMGGMAPRKEFSSLAEYTTWERSLEPAGPPTVRTGPPK